MKFHLLTILLFELTISCSQRTDSKTESKSVDTTTIEKTEKADSAKSVQLKDTLTIVDSDLTIDPFDLGANPLSKLTSIDRATTNYQTYKNRHVDNQIDTSFQITIEPDTFEVYKTASENWLTEAKVSSDNFKTRHGIQIGMNKSEVREQLNKTQEFPDFVRLQNFEVLEWVDLKFEDDRLETIEFKGYMD